MDDPDAPGGTWNHWLVWNIPADIHSLSDSSMPSSAKSEPMISARVGYGGPCPPKGEGPHRYFFHLFAMDVATLGVAKGANRPALEKMLRKHILAEQTYMGRNERAR